MCPAHTTEKAAPMSPCHAYLQHTGHSSTTKFQPTIALCRARLNHVNVP